MIRNVRIGELLIQDGLLTPAQLEEALAYQKSAGAGRKIGDILIEQGYISENDFITALHKKLGLPVVDLSHFRVNLGAVALLPQTLAQKYTALPLDADETTITVAMQNPTDYYAIDDLELVTHRSVKPVIAQKESILLGIERAYNGTIDAGIVDNANKESYDPALVLEEEESSERVNSAPIVQLVNAMLNQATKMRASDIHIEPLNEKVRVRFRVDGELLEIMELNISVLGGLVTRIKIMANMDIAEKRLPQDGRFTAIIGAGEVHTRVATMPTLYGEKVVIRLLGNATTDVLHVSQLGMTESNQVLFRRLLNVPSGIILVTGPTGSGKTTTLYSAMMEISKPSLNVISIEDPVEKAIYGMNQMQINTKAGIEFASGLRALLRQDPDVIMIGEVRDPETAQIAARAAITGHLVLSTIHTNDAPSTFARLIDMGVEPYVVASAMMGVISQRLVRVLCPHCKRAAPVTAIERELAPELELGETVYQPAGCIHCNNTGYLGRTAVHEILTVTTDIRQLISSRASVEEVRHQAEQRGFVSLRHNMLQLVREGTSSLPELMRITFSLD